MPTKKVRTHSNRTSTPLRRGNEFQQVPPSKRGAKRHFTFGGMGIREPRGQNWQYDPPDAPPNFQPSVSGVRP